MKNIIGFAVQDEDAVDMRTATEHSESSAPVKSVVQVRFPEISRCYAYYNDRFDLRQGNLVFVSGKLAGVPGIVESVNYKFKISLSDYERVIACPDISIHGTYIPVTDKTVSYDYEAVNPDTFRSWIKPPVDGGVEAPEFITGEGYRFDLEHFMEDDDVEKPVFQRAWEYYRDGRVRYLSVRNGVGTAFVKGSKWYEINFRFENGFISDMFCECPYAALCKHNLAVLIELREMARKTRIDDFTAIDRGFFLRMLAISRQSITVG